MNKPTIASTTPAVMEVERGTYHWCSCGKSANQPFCDGSHKGTTFMPIAFRMESKKRVALCTCKLTEKGPFCDGSHKKLKGDRP